MTNANQIFQRAARVLRTDGPSSLARRVLRRITKAHEGELAAARAEYDRQVAEFERRARSAGEEELLKFFWYHTIDLGDGLLTPGDYDYRAALDAFHFPREMTGMNVLDVGSATGFFAFEFERRGASVVSVDLPSLLDWDMVSGERDAIVRSLMEGHGASSPEEATFRHLEGPFRYCGRKLGSNVRRVHSKIYDLTPEKVGRSAFDLIFVGDVLLHLFSPFGALNALAPLCSGTLVLTSDHDPGGGERPEMRFLGRSSDSRSWWYPNASCIEAMLHRVGFGNVAHVGTNRGVARREWFFYERDVFHARRT